MTHDTLSKNNELNFLQRSTHHAMVHPEVVAGLCTALTFACAVQILITCFLAFAFSQFMSVLHCNLATASGAVSGLVTVPTVIQLRASQISTHVGRKYGYTVWYKRLAIGICCLMQAVTWLCTIVNICTPYDRNTFLKVMKEYSKKQASKSIVDNIQWFLQCCGARNYKDWFAFNWGGFVFDTSSSRRKKSIPELLFGDTDVYPDLSTMRSDAVPFSCCAEIAKSACVHSNLEQLGTFTINTEGCTYRLAATKQSILWVEFSIYTICLIVEVTILVLLRGQSESQDGLAKESPKVYHSAEKKEYSKFLNQKADSDS